MLVNANFKLPVQLTPNQQQWVASPQPGVERVMLDRIGGEVARATSIVRYGPASSFPRHTHEAGEEILVLSGTFSDESGDYPAGWYLRNPPGSSHQPFTKEGAVIFVKLRQMRSTEHASVSIDTNDPTCWEPEDGGQRRCPLFADQRERVFLLRLRASAAPIIDTAGGVEMLVLSGKLMTEGRIYPPRSWLRFPDGVQPSCQARYGDVLLYVKTGHLAATVQYS